jgi:predicted KAP-like P-loop ATPase
MPAPSRRNPPTLLADVPIDLPKDDQLGRVPFERSLAKTIKAMKGRDSFVFGLCELRSGRSESKPLMCNFNPWWFSGQDQLLRVFLTQLGSIVGGSSGLADRRTS